MAFVKTICTEMDHIHGSRHGTHSCSCNKQGQHGDGKHTCPTCGRQWGHPDFAAHPLKKTPKGT